MQRISSNKPLICHRSAVLRCYEELADIKKRFGPGDLSKIIVDLLPPEVRQIINMSKIDFLDIDSDEDK